jgi:hypothetical protein
MSELEEMRTLLESRGFDPLAADCLADEGMGPFELIERLRCPAGQIGSLEYTHNIHRMR